MLTYIDCPYTCSRANIENSLKFLFFNRGYEKPSIKGELPQVVLQVYIRSVSLNLLFKRPFTYPIDPVQSKKLVRQGKLSRGFNEEYTPHHSS